MSKLLVFLFVVDVWSQTSNLEPHFTAKIFTWYNLRQGLSFSLGVYISKTLSQISTSSISRKKYWFFSFPDNIGILGQYWLSIANLGIGIMLLNYIGPILAFHDTGIILAAYIGPILAYNIIYIITIGPILGQHWPKPNIGPILGRWANNL